MERPDAETGQKAHKTLATVEVGGVEPGHGCRISGIRQRQRKRQICAQIARERACEGCAEGGLVRGGGHTLNATVRSCARSLPRFAGEGIVMLMLTLGSPLHLVRRITHL